MREETVQNRSLVRGIRQRLRELTLVAAMSGLTCALALAAPAASAGAAQRAAAGISTTSISTSKFVNQFDTEPYVGNGYFSQRIPAAGMGLLRGLGTIGWPLGTPRFTEALAAGLYAKTNASVQYYPTETKQVISLIPTWSTLTFTTPTGSTYGPATVKASQIRGYRQTENLNTGTVTTSGTWTAPRGHKRANFTYQVLTDLGRKHVGLVVLRLTPRWSGRTVITGLLDGRGASRLRPAGAGRQSALPHESRELDRDRHRLPGHGILDAALLSPDRQGPRDGAQQDADGRRAHHVHRPPRAHLYLHQVRRRRHQPGRQEAGDHRR